MKERTKLGRYLISGILLVAACEGVPQPSQPMKEFSNEEALMTWVASLTDSGVLKHARVTRGSAGPTSISLEDPTDRATLAEALGGDSGTFKLAGEIRSADFLKPKQPGPQRADGPVQQALTSGIGSEITKCDHQLCTYNSSNNTHISLGKFGYHDVGGVTTVTSGGWREVHESPIVLPGCNSDSRNPCPTGCPAGDVWVEGNRTGNGYCMHTEGWDQLTVSNTYFADNGEAVDLDESGANNVATWGLSKTALGVNASPCFPGGPPECTYGGVCTLHFTQGEGGITSVTTADGKYDCKP